MTLRSTVLFSGDVTCHGDSSFPLTAVPCEEDSDFLVTTTCVTVVLEGKLLELEVDVERDDEGLEPDNDVSCKTKNK